MTTSTKEPSDEQIQLEDVVGKLYFDQGLTLAQKRKYEEAIPRLEEASKLCQEKSAPLIVLAKISLYQGAIAAGRSYLDGCSSDQPKVQEQVSRLRNALDSSARRTERGDAILATISVMGTKFANGFRTGVVKTIEMIRPLGWSRRDILWILIIALAAFSATSWWYRRSNQNPNPTDPQSENTLESGFIESPLVPSEKLPSSTDDVDDLSPEKPTESD